MLFDGSAVHNVKHELSQGWQFVNVFDAYRRFRDQPDMAADYKALKGLRTCQPRWYDRHPTLSERIDAISGLPDAPAPAQSASAAELLTNLVAVEQKLTELLTRHVYNALQIGWMQE